MTNLKNINNIDFLRELFRRMKEGEIMIKNKKWKSNYNGSVKKQAVIISDKNNPKNHIVSYKTEGQTLWIEGKRSF
ncbi:MAG: hypothetical protein mread185_000461 [Mycoplasmataceae bacterium]|nr:MAG: hypothetical protein mread185_000461 [Mycoplasmataceae bacterium]